MKKYFYIFVFTLFQFNIHSQTLYFPPIAGNTWDTISPSSLNWCQPAIDSLYQMLDENQTNAFILLKDGKIVLEKYFGTFTATSPWYWASAGKTITSFMVGMAQQENYLSIDDTTSNYLGAGWTICPQDKEEKITIRNQLTMTSGLNDDVPDHYCTLDTCLSYLADAGTRWAYHNGPYTLLDSVIQLATGYTLNNYTTQKLKNPTGMTGTFVTVDYNHVFFSTARSMARFGLLILNNGNWNGNQIMTDTNYFQQMTTPSQFLNPSYGYLWWLNGQSGFLMPGSQFLFPGSWSPNAPSDMIAALGKNGQFINVVPSKNMVWIRMGDNPNQLDVPFLLNDLIWEKINMLDCNVGIAEEPNENNIAVYPNPVHDKLYVQSKEMIVELEIIDISGKVLISEKLNSQLFHFPVSSLTQGIYMLRIKNKNGQIVIRKILRSGE